MGGGGGKDHERWRSRAEEDVQSWGGAVPMVVCLRGQAEGQVLVGSSERLGTAEPERVG